MSNALNSAEVSKLIDTGAGGGVEVLFEVSRVAVAVESFALKESSSEDRRPGEVVGDFSFVF